MQHEKRGYKSIMIVGGGTPSVVDGVATYTFGPSGGSVDIKWLNDPEEQPHTMADGGTLVVDRKSGAIAIAGQAKVGATLQFHVRDAKSADDDLRKLLSRHDGRQIAGAMLFGCNGRGTNMWPEPGHDVRVMRELLGDLPLAGCFCGGEFGPVGGKNFVHGFTASIALFSEPQDD